MALSSLSLMNLTHLILSFPSLAAMSSGRLVCTAGKGYCNTDIQQRLRRASARCAPPIITKIKNEVSKAKHAPRQTVLAGIRMRELVQREHFSRKLLEFTVVRRSAVHPHRVFDCCRSQLLHRTDHLLRKRLIWLRTAFVSPTAYLRA
jgi:hypothetical protein